MTWRELDRRQRAARAIRIYVLVIGAAALVAAILGIVPSIEIYRAQHDCFGQAIIGLLEFKPVESCAPAWVLVETRSVFALQSGDVGLAAVVLVPGVLVWLRPRWRSAFLWPVLGFGAAILLMWATFSFDFGRRSVDLLPAVIFWNLASAIALAILALIPISLVMGWQREPVRDTGDTATPI
ncbi:MAG: hypothetical protein ABI591_10745 [Kofleriaceae bacterium]